MLTDRTYQSQLSNQTNQTQLSNNAQVEPQKSEQKKDWTKKVCFVLGVITGGSIVAIVSKILYANN